MAVDSHRWVTVKPLLFNEPKSGEVIAIPPGEPCTLLESVDDARRRGLLPDEMAVWAAKTNVQRGYSLAWLRGLVRGVAHDDVAPRSWQAAQGTQARGKGEK